MPDPTLQRTLDTIASLTRDHLLPKMVDQIINVNYLTYRLLRKSKPVSGGIDIVQLLEYGDERPKWMGEWDKTTYEKREFATQARFGWCKLKDAIVFSEKALHVVNTGPEQILSMASVASKNVAKTFRRGFQDMIFANRAHTSKEPYNLYDIVYNYNVLLAGIDPTDSKYAWWKARKLTIPGTKTYANIDDPEDPYFLMKVIGAMYDALCSDNENPTVIVTTHNIWRHVEQIYRKQGVADVKYRKVNGTFEVLEFGNAEIVWDSKCPAGHMYFLNDNYIYFKHHKNFNFKLGEFKELPTGEDAYGMDLKWWGALTVSNRAYQGGVFGIPETSLTIL